MKLYTTIVLLFLSIFISAQTDINIGSINSINYDTSEITTVVGYIVADVSTNANINFNPLPFVLSINNVQTNTIEGSVVGLNNFSLPQGNYEVKYKLKLDSNAARTNFKVNLRSNGFQIDDSYGGFYARNASGSDDTGDAQFFALENFTGGVIDLITQREASAGDVNLDGGTVIITKFETIKVLVP